MLLSWFHCQLTHLHLEKKPNKTAMNLVILVYTITIWPINVNTCSFEHKPNLITVPYRFLDH